MARTCGWTGQSGWRRAEGAVEIIFRQDRDVSDEIAETNKDNEDRFANPFGATQRISINEVIYPRSTRRRIALELRKLWGKCSRTREKHNNILV